MARHPLISVCVPTYNGARYVEQALRSVLAQEEDLELVVVDDGSTDSTVEVVRSIDDRRLRLHQSEAHRGIPGSWNLGTELAAGELVCIFHQDDVMLAGNLSDKARMLAADPAMSFVHSAVELLVEPPALAPASWVDSAEADFVSDGEDYFWRLLLGGNRVCAPAVVARRQLLRQAGGFDEDLGYTPDYELWMKLCLLGRVGFLARPRLQYRWHGRNESHGFRYERGVDEIALARTRAVEYFVARTGRRSEGELLSQVLSELTARERWAADLQRSAEGLERHAAELEEARVWLEGEWTAWRATAAEQTRINAEQAKWIADLEQTRAWLERERTAWQKTAAEETRINAEQAKWIAELDRDRSALQRTAAEQARSIEELERGRAWLEEQRGAWQRTAEIKAREFAAASRQIESLLGSATWRLRNKLLRVPGLRRSYRWIRKWSRAGGG